LVDPSQGQSADDDFKRLAEHKRQFDLHTNDLTRNGNLFVSSSLERFLERSDESNVVWHRQPFRVTGGSIRLVNRGFDLG